MRNNKQTNIPAEAQVPRRRAYSYSRSPETPESPERDYPQVYPFTRSELKCFENLVLIDDEPLLGQVDLANDYQYMSFRDTTNLNAFSCGQLLDQSNLVLKYVNELNQGFINVQKETSSLQETCNNLLAEQNKLSNLCDNIEKNLKHFTSLERIMRTLNSPGTDLVIRSTFPALLDQLDEGLEYVQKHKHFKNIEVYQQRFRHCMTRALGLIQVYFQGVLRDLENEVNVNGAKISNVAAQNVLLYSKFEAESNQILNLTSEIARRCETHEEYDGLLHDCMRNYFGTRYKLLTPLLAKNAEESSKDMRNIVQFSRSNLTFYKDLCTQEYNLFLKFFDTGEDAFLNWLTDICGSLYDTVRQRVIRETDINLLCELTSLLLSYKEEQDDDQEEFHDNESLNQNDSNQHDDSDSQGPLAINFHFLFTPVLQDVQSRLLFRVQAYVEQEIVRHVPKEQDLYGISHRRGTHKRTSSTATDSSKQLSNRGDLAAREYDPENLYKEWYPPMRKAIALLSQIYQLISSTIFDDLAHRIVHECLISLQAAHNLARSRIGILESDLFLIKHLLILRQQITEFDIEYVPADVRIDFSGLAEVIALVRTEGVSFNSAHLLNLAKISVPKVVNNMFDAKEELYAKVRNTIHEFTEEAVKQVVKSINGSPSVETALEDTRQLREDAATEIPRLRKMIENYIDEQRTVDILIDSIQVSECCTTNPPSYKMILTCHFSRNWSFKYMKSTIWKWLDQLPLRSYLMVLWRWKLSLRGLEILTESFT